MSVNSKIEWTDATWNPVTGCSPVSPGCKHCYAEKLAWRLQRMGNPSYQNGFGVSCHPELLDLPMRWRKPRRIFVCSMADLFHVNVPADFIHGVFEVMEQAGHHTFQVLTKRSARLEAFGSRRLRDLPENVWMGVTVEDQAHLRRVHSLLKIPAKVRFLSLEPLLGPVDLEPVLAGGGIHWVIVGGETGPGARPMHPDWVATIRDQCQRAKVPFFFKQWGQFGPIGPMNAKNEWVVFLDGRFEKYEDATKIKGVYAEWPLVRPVVMRNIGRKSAGCQLDGREWKEMPYEKQTPDQT